MGMFDSFYDETGREWQTKAFDCGLDVWEIGDRFESEGPQTFQVEVLGSDYSKGSREDFRDSFATIRNGVVEAVDVPRDDTLPLIDYGGHLSSVGERS
jgi:hypothetical protein